MEATQFSEVKKIDDQINVIDHIVKNLNDKTLLSLVFNTVGDQSVTIFPLAGIVKSGAAETEVPELREPTELFRQQIVHMLNEHRAKLMQLKSQL